jgi:eukaryotic-like serine/threonine-protein kinase
MGEVYRARDTKLPREVALKTLPQDLALEPDRLARLKSEARILATLNHPGIAILHGLEEGDGGVPVLVMELVDGETLADRLRRKPLPVREAMAIGQQIAIALEAAHQKGVLHRDLKPANIRLTADGRVKLLDFGLAKAVMGVGVNSQLDTHTSPASGAGVVLGTAPYMSPEQARAQEVDRRTDVWSFGCVLFEMLAGKRAFEGATFSDTVAAVLDREPDWKAFPRETPRALLRLLQRCLQKEKDRRLRDIGDARLELEELLAPPVSSAGEENESAIVTSRIRGWQRLTGSSLLWLSVTAAAAGALGWAVGASKLLVSRSVQRWTIPLALPGPVYGLAWSPDGTSLVYSAIRDGRLRLYLRTLDRLEDSPISGTDSPWGLPLQPFFSPDGGWMAFSAATSLKKVPTSGGAPLTLCDPCNPKGATWGPDGTVVYAPGTAAGLSRVNADGGASQALTVLDARRQESSHRFPEFVPEGQGVIFTVKHHDAASWSDARIEAVSLRTGERSTLVEGGSHAQYLTPGHLVYHRWGNLWAAPFDPVRLKVTGSSVRVLDGVSSSSEYGQAYFALSRDGSLAYVPGKPQGSDRTLALMDRDGKRKPLLDEGRPYESVKVSPDGRRLVLQIGGANDQIWVYDMERGTLTPQTLRFNNSDPIWTRDGQRLTFTSNREGSFDIFSQPADGSGPGERLTTSSEGQFPISASWSPDGQALVFFEGSNTTRADLWTVRVDGDRKPHPLLRGPFNVISAAVSPDGRWFAYTSNESGRDEVYVRPFSESNGRWPISVDGGEFPVWAKDGRELYYRNGDRIMAVAVRSEKTFFAAKPRVLFEAKYPETHGRPNYDVMPTGEFVVIEPGESDTVPSQINVILHWAEEVRQRVPVR